MSATLFPVTEQDADQVVKLAYDETTQSIRSTAVATISGDVTVDIDAASGDNIALADSTGTKKVDVETFGGKNGLDVNVIHSVLPDSAATEATLSTINGKLNTLGQKTSAGSVPVVIASDQPTINVKTVPGSAGSLQIKTGVYGAISVNGTPTPLRVGGSNLTNRIAVTAIPTNGDIWYGYDALVTPSTGTPITMGAFYGEDITDSLSVYLVSAGPTINVRITEGSDQ